MLVIILLQGWWLSCFFSIYILLFCWWIAW